MPGIRRAHIRGHSNQCPAIVMRVTVQIAHVKEIAAESLGGAADDYDVADERVFNTGDASRSMSYAEVASRAIELGGRYSGAEMPDDIHVVTQRADKSEENSGRHQCRPLTTLPPRARSNNWSVT